LQKVVLTALRKLEIVHFKTIKTNTIGISDIVICFAGKFIALELKSENGKCSIAQELFLERVTCNGGTGVIVRCFEDVMKAIGYTVIRILCAEKGIELMQGVPQVKRDA
jgi:hypothetical protein